ncbi:MAG: hypothetical protein H0U75_04445 [Legionella sp.]|nr:hypothetical protein [Legionella sp.]
MSKLQKACIRLAPPSNIFLSEALPLCASIQIGKLDPVVARFKTICFKSGRCALECPWVILNEFKASSPSVSADSTRRAKFRDDGHSKLFLATSNNGTLLLLLLHTRRILTHSSKAV